MEKSKRILEFCISAKSNNEIAEMLGYKDRKTVRKYVKPLVEQGRLAMTIMCRGNPGRVVRTCFFMQ